MSKNKSKAKLTGVISRKRGPSDNSTEEEPNSKNFKEGNMTSSGETISVESLRAIIAQSTQANNEELKVVLGQMITALGDSIMEKFFGMLGEMATRVKKLEEAQKQSDSVISDLRKEVEYLKKKALEKNLIIHGIAEETEETPWSLEAAVERRFTEMGFTNVAMDKVSRIGSQSGKPRHTKVRLIKQFDKDRILQGRNQHGATKIHEDLPAETRKVRKIIGEFVGLMRSQGKDAKFRGDHAIVENSKISYPEAQKILQNGSVNSAPKLLPHNQPLIVSCIS